MKSKKKIGLVKRITAGVCALVVAASCVGSSEAYYAREVSFNENGEQLLCSYADVKFRDAVEVIFSDEIKNELSNYKYYMFFKRSSDYKLVLANEKPYLSYSYSELDSGYSYKATLQIPNYKDDSLIYTYSVDESLWDSGIYGGTSAYNALFYVQDLTKYDSLIFSSDSVFENNFDLCFESGELFLKSSVIEEVYNSSLGYLQDIKRQFIYLEDDDWSIVEDTAACKFTFANITTSGFDITDGNWSIRHYMQIEVKNAKKEYETVDVYDKVYLDEYAAADGKIVYQQKDTVQRLHEESGFNGLSWWESNFLGYITYYNDYFQLVRTNEDGSVEYGGYVKVWQDEYNINHSTTLGEDESQDNSGYNDNIVSGSHGSGGTYEEAEKNADENAANSSTSNGEALAELDNILSTITAVPEAFSRMFSFLPDWCLDSIGIAIVAGVAIIIWKTGRG